MPFTSKPVTLHRRTVTPLKPPATSIPPLKPGTPGPETVWPAQSRVTLLALTRMLPWWSSVSVVSVVITIVPDEAWAGDVVSTGNRAIPSTTVENIDLVMCDLHDLQDFKSLFLSSEAASQFRRPLCLEPTPGSMHWGWHLYGIVVAALTC